MRTITDDVAIYRQFYQIVVWRDTQTQSLRRHKAANQALRLYMAEFTAIPPTVMDFIHSFTHEQDY
jgi:hypothetical protein